MMPRTNAGTKRAGSGTEKVGLARLVSKRAELSRMLDETLAEIVTATSILDASGDAGGAPGSNRGENRPSVKRTTRKRQKAKPGTSREKDESRSGKARPDVGPAENVASENLQGSEAPSADGDVTSQGEAVRATGAQAVSSCLAAAGNALSAKSIAEEILRDSGGNGEGIGPVLGRVKRTLAKMKANGEVVPEGNARLTKWRLREG